MLGGFSVIYSFLYATLGACAIGGGLTTISKPRVDKLANNELKDHKALENVMGDNGLKISKNVILDEKYDFEGVCMIAPTGAGKTTSLFLNNLLENNIRGSYIIPDPKGELYELTSGYQKNICNRKVYKIDFNNPDYTERYNLLENCKNSEEVIQLASSLLTNGSLSIELMTGKKTGGVEWIQMAEPLLAAMLLYVKDLGKPYNNIEFAIQLILNLNTEQMGKLIERSRNLDAMTQYSIFLTVGGADRTEGSIKITLATNMKLFTTKDVNKISLDTTFSIEDFRNEESVLYIIYPERKSNYLAPFIAPLFSQIIDRLIDCYHEKSLPIHMLFDEFGNIGMLSNMNINASTVRSRKISLTICLQSITQLYQIYGEYNAKSILNNLKTKIVLHGVTDADTISYISNLCGVEEISIQSISKSENKLSISNSKTKKRIFEDGELRTLKDNTGLIIMNNNMPVVDDVELYFRTDKINNISEPIKYSKSNSVYFDIKKEIEKIKSNTLESNLEKADINDKARRAVSRIFS